MLLQNEARFAKNKPLLFAMEIVPRVSYGGSSVSGGKNHGDDDSGSDDDGRARDQCVGGMHGH